MIKWMLILVCVAFSIKWMLILEMHSEATWVALTTPRSRGARHRVTWNASVMPSVAAQDAAADTKAATASRHKRELAAHGYAFVALKREFVRPLPPPARPA